MLAQFHRYMESDIISIEQDMRFLHVLVNSVTLFCNQTVICGPRKCASAAAKMH